MRNPFATSGLPLMHSAVFERLQVVLSAQILCERPWRSLSHETW